LWRDFCTVLATGLGGLRAIIEPCEDTAFRMKSADARRDFRCFTSDRKVGVTAISSAVAAIGRARTTVFNTGSFADFVSAEAGTTVDTLVSIFVEKRIERYTKSQVGEKTDVDYIRFQIAVGIGTLEVFLDTSGNGIQGFIRLQGGGRQEELCA
jgi:hypothetical protein